MTKVIIADSDTKEVLDTREFPNIEEAALYLSEMTDAFGDQLELSMKKA